MHRIYVVLLAIIISIGVIALIPQITFAQTEEQLQWLLRFSEEQVMKWRTERAIAESIAQAQNMPIRQEFPDGKIIELQRFENGLPMYYITHNLNAAKTLSTDKVWPGGTGGFSLTGSSETLGIWDGGRTRIEHQEFATGRATQVDGASTNSDHATHVAGTMIASGTAASAKGMSYQARLRAYDWNNDNSEMATAAAGGLKVSNHSYGYITGWYTTDGASWHWYGDPSISSTKDYKFGFYSSYAQAWDNIARNAPYYLIVKSAGNDRLEGPSSQPVTHTHSGSGSYNCIHGLDGGPNGYDCIGAPGVAKNILTVGAVDDIVNGYSQPNDVVMSPFSCWGPTDDGRIKPDIVANGIELYSCIATNNTAYTTYSGTSMSSPNAAGSTGLLLHLRRNLYGNNPLRSSTIKGLIIHTADEAGPHPGPDYMFGWGLMNTLKAAQVMRADSLAGGNFHIREYTLNQGGQIEFQVYSTGSQPLRATICWTDPAGTPPPPSLDPTTIMLVNDLDLRIIGPGSTIYSPWVLNPSNPSVPATTGDNIRDNVEQVHIASPSAGFYTVRINHKGTLSGGSQVVSVIVTGNTIFKDVAVTAIEYPTGIIDSSGPIIPRVRVKNNGTTNETFNVTFRIIGTSYNQTRTKTLSAGVEDTVNFPSWTPIRGTYTTRCSTYLASDAIKSNDTLSGWVKVQTKDIEVVAIEHPVGTVDSTSTPIVPRIRVRNNGSETEVFNATFKIGTIYNNTRTKSLASGIEDTINFAQWIPARGTYTTRCSIYLAGDMKNSNDTLSAQCIVQVRNVGVVSITAPADTIFRDYISPKASVRNYGTKPETFYVYCKIFDSLRTQVYLDSSYVSNLNTNASSTRTFKKFYFRTGNYEVRCSTALNNDANPLNDVKSKIIVVKYLPPWILKESIPWGPSNKAVKAGGAIVTGTQDKIYALKGNNTREFYVYFVDRDSWALLESIPFDTLSRKKVNKGACLAYNKHSNPNTIYATKGNNSLEFWMYNVNLDTWIQKPNVPMTYPERKVKGGASMVYLKRGQYQYIYLLKGNNTLEFYAYHCDADTWIKTLTLPPPGPNLKAFRDGSCMTVGKYNKIYALKGGAYINEFYRYDPGTNIWEVLSPLPIYSTLTRKNTKVKDGASLCYDGDSLIYAFKGGNRQEFWVYNINQDRWLELDTVPKGTGGKKIGSGAGLAFADDKVFALKGNKTREFWCYTPGISDLDTLRKPQTDITHQQTIETNPSSSVSQIEILPNLLFDQSVIRFHLVQPSRLKLSLYNSFGQLLSVIVDKEFPIGKAEIPFNKSGLSSGVYFLKCDISPADNLIIRKGIKLIVR